MPLCPFHTRPAAAALLTALLAGGCVTRVGGDGTSYLNENDALRRANLELERELDETTRRLELLEGELAAHRTAPDAGRPIPGAVRPVLSGLEFGRYTGPVDGDGDGVDDEVRVYLRPLDQRGRMLVVTGALEVQVLSLAGDAPPVVVAERRFGPGELDGAYRSGFTGSHYSVSLDLPTIGGGMPDVTVLAVLTEAGSGVQVRRQAAFALSR